MNSEKKIVQDPKRIRPSGSEVLKLVSDNRKAAGLLRWAPKMSLDDGLKEAIAFVEANIGLYRTDTYNV